MKDTADLICAHLNDEATPEETRRLFDWIQADPANAKEFARATMLHAQMREQLSGERQVRESGELSAVVVPAAKPEVPSQEIARSTSRVESWKSASLTVSIVACLLAAVVFVLSPSGNERIVEETKLSEDFVTVAQTVDVVWNGSQKYRSGNRAGTSSFDLKSGFVRLHLDSGVEVTLEGPAKFELVSVEYSKFHAGLLTSTVPPGAEGFRVDTPSAEVVDLGTAFGIRLSDDGVSHVSVFDGEVEVGRPDSDEKQLLNEGEAVRIAPARDIEAVPFDASAYEKIWPVSSGIVASSGAFGFAPPWPRRLRRVRSDTEMFVIPERYAVTLEAPLRVNVSSPGKYVRTDELTPSSISEGESVRSFILHYYPEEARRPRFAKRIEGSIVFDRPILGLIILHEELRDSAGRFSPRNAGEHHQRRQIDLRGGLAGDQITLSEDRRTVTVNLTSANLSSDLMRVIVDASYPSTEPAHQEISLEE